MKLEKTITAENQQIPITITDIQSPSGHTVLHCETVFGGVTYAERMTIGTDVDSTPEQLQKDFDAHCLRVATQAARRSKIKSLLSGLK